MSFKNCSLHDDLGICQRTDDSGLVFETAFPLSLRHRYSSQSAIVALTQVGIGQCVIGTIENRAGFLSSSKVEHLPQEKKMRQAQPLGR